MATSLVIAGGNGVRTGYAVPKQFLTINEKPLFIYTLENIQLCDEISKIKLVIPKGWESFVTCYCLQYKINKLLPLAFGGETRHKSIRNGIEALNDEMPLDEMIVIIDANRPILNKETIHNCIEAAKRSGASLAAIPCYDSMYKCSSEEMKSISISEHIDRTRLFMGQNPECVKLKLLMEIYKKAESIKPCDMSTSALLAYFKYPVEVIKGSQMNFKITSSEDIKIFKALVSVYSL